MTDSASKAAAPTLSLTRNGPAIASVELDAGQVEVTNVAVSELQRCGFELSPREADTDYAIAIGDLEPPGGLAVGRAFRQEVLWEDAPYFESARGIVQVSLRSRPVDSETDWRPRARMRLAVVPSKLGEARYRAMFEQLRSLAAGLLFDLLSKTTRDVAYVHDARARPSPRSSQLELRAIEQTWTVIARSLYDIEREPALRLTRSLRVRPSWGAEALRPNAFARLAASGIDMRSPHTTRPVPVLQDVLGESADTIEHRIIAGFIVMLARRVRECQQNAKEEIEHLEDTRPYRDVVVEPGPTLYEIFDRPRIERLHEAVRLADELLICLRRAATLSVLRGLRPSFAAPRTSVFRHVASYHAVGAAMSTYLQSSIVVLEDGSAERLKSTSRMYEHWVFFQIVSAFREAGLVCEDVGDILRRLSSERFTLDLDERTEVVLRADAGRLVIVRYEPWILPRDAARREGQSIYRGRSGSTPWRPDVVIEFASPSTEDAVAETSYAVVVDAKYAKEIRDEHWAGTEKYAEIRAVADNRQVVRQVWLAYPGSDGVTCRDPAVMWTEGGPDRPFDEAIFGRLGLRPPETVEGPSEEVVPVESARIFVRGLLRYIGVLDG